MIERIKNEPAEPEDSMRAWYLKQDEKWKSRRLWEQCFYEDSARFIKYYYEEKCRDNQILVLAEKGGTELISMIHRNPYRMYWKGTEYTLDYIVGVATAFGWRHRGCMRRLLNRVFSDQYQERMPFTFLMPADPGIYQPFGFTYVYDRQQPALTREGESLSRLPVMEMQDAVTAGIWMNQWMHRRYSLFAIRDEAYIVRLMKEIKSEYGSLDLILDRNQIVGMECVWGKGNPEQRFLYAEERYLEFDARSYPSVMVRIINLEEFMKNIRLKPGKEEVAVCIGIIDRQIGRNHGLFAWQVTEEGSRLERLSEEIPEGVWTMPIEGLTQWLMGYCSLEQSEGYGLWGGIPDRAGREILGGIDTDEKIFIDEVV